MHCYSTITPFLFLIRMEWGVMVRGSFFFFGYRDCRRMDPVVINLRMRLPLFNQKSPGIFAYFFLIVRAILDFLRVSLLTWAQVAGDP